MVLGASALLGSVSDSKQVSPCPKTLTPHFSFSLSASLFLLSKIGLDLFPSPFYFFESHRFTSRREMLRKEVEYPLCILLNTQSVSFWLGLYLRWKETWWANLQWGWWKVLGVAGMKEREEGGTERTCWLGSMCQSWSHKGVFSLMREDGFLAYRRQSSRGEVLGEEETAGSWHLL